MIVGYKANQKAFYLDTHKLCLIQTCDFLGNCTSGSNEGEYILSTFRRVLNPAQVIDLAQKSPEEALEWCHLLQGTTCRVIVAGGDGTVGWVFNTIFKLKLNVSFAKNCCNLKINIKSQ